MLAGTMTPTKETSETKLSIKQVADRLGENSATVKGWRRRGLFPHAELVDTPRGPVWQIPLSDVEKFKKPIVGRPPKSKATSKKAKT